VTSEEEAYALIVSPGVGDGFGWEVWGPRGELAAPRIDSGQAITLDAAQAAAEASPALAAIPARRAREAQDAAQREAREIARDRAERIAWVKANPSALRRITGDYFEVTGRNGRVGGHVLGDGPTRDTAYKAIDIRNEAIAPEYAPGGYAPTRDEAAAMLV